MKYSEDAHHQLVTLPRAGCSSKTDEKTRNKLVKEAVKRPTATLKELHQLVLSVQYTSQQSPVSISCLGCGVRLHDGSLFLQKKTSHPGSYSLPHVGNMSWSDECFGYNSTLHMRRTPYPQ